MVLYQNCYVSAFLSFSQKQVMVEVARILNPVVSVVEQVFAIKALNYTFLVFQHKVCIPSIMVVIMQLVVKAEECTVKVAVDDLVDLLYILDYSFKDDNLTSMEYTIIHILCSTPFHQIQMRELFLEHSAVVLEHIGVVTKVNTVVDIAVTMVMVESFTKEVVSDEAY